MEYIFYKVGIAEYQNPSYEPGPELTSQDDPTREEVMELLEIQQPNYFENLEGLYNNKHVIRVNQIGVGYTYWMLTPISIAYQAERIQIAKANIRTSIISKGGTITAEERLDKFAEYIDNIQVAKTEQEKTVTTPDFSAGDVVVTPDANKVLSKATVKKDANLVAGNIKDGVTLFGVTGDYEGEGGGAPIGYNVTFDYFDDISSTSYITVYAVVNGVAQNYTEVNYVGINLNLTNVTYITAFENGYNGPKELRHHTITGATTAQLLNGLIPTQNISFSLYSKD